MAESNPQRKLPNLAAHHSKKREQILPIIYNAQPFVPIGMEAMIHVNRHDENLYATLQQRLFARLVPIALPMLEPVDYEYKSNKSVRHSFF